MELTTLILIGLMTIIMLVSNQSQTRALLSIRNAAEDFIAIQIRDRRRKAEQQVSMPQPLLWLERKLNIKLEKPLAVDQMLRVIPEVAAIEFSLRENRGRLLVTTSTPKSIRDFETHQKSSMSKQARRVAASLSKPILPSGMFAPRLQVIELSMATEGVAFDIEAGTFGKQFGVSWGEPDRLMCILLPK
jgi:hypothetical protein